MKEYKSKKEFKKDLPYLSAVEIYKKVLSGRYIKKFPNGFWQNPEAHENAKAVTQYLIEDILKWSDKDIKEKLVFNIFKKYKLQGMMIALFNSSIFKLIDFVYPDKFKPWELPRVPTNYWNKQTLKEATIWLIEEKLKWSDEDIKEKINLKIFIKYGIDVTILHKSAYNLINNAYPDKFKPWELPKVNKNYWNDKTIKEAIEWLVEEKLKINENDDLRDILNQESFKKYSLDSLLNSSFFKGSPFLAINFVYPGRFKPWQFKQTYKHYWNKETAKGATKWLIKEKLELDDEGILSLTKEPFIKNGMDGMLQHIYNSSIYKAINALYPDKFKPWQFKNVPVSINYWNNEIAKEAVKWLIEEKLGYKEYQIVSNIKKTDFVKYGLQGMIFVLFNGSMKKAINNAYPNLYK